MIKLSKLCGVALTMLVLVLVLALVKRRAGIEKFKIKPRKGCPGCSKCVRVVKFNKIIPKIRRSVVEKFETADNTDRKIPMVCHRIVGKKYLTISSLI